MQLVSLQKVAVVAIGRNEGERLRGCLRSVPPGIGVIYVDSGSTDGSPEFAARLGSEVVCLEMSTPFTAARARNDGFARLRAQWPETEYVQFVDGDCELEVGWIEEATDFMEGNQDVAVACGRRRERYPERSHFNRWMDEEWDTPIGPVGSCGGDAIIRIAALDEVGGYDGNLIAGEEPELCNRLRSAGWRICRLDSPMTIHDADIHKFRQWWMRAVRSGYGYAQVWQKTSHSPGGRLYSRELARSFAWSAGVTGVAVLLALVIGPIGLVFAPAFWSLQIARLSRKAGALKALYLVIGKAAEAYGALRFFKAHLTQELKNPIFYK